MRRKSLIQSVLFYYALLCATTAVTSRDGHLLHHLALMTVLLTALTAVAASFLCKRSNRAAQ